MKIPRTYHGRKMTGWVLAAGIGMFILVVGGIVLASFVGTPKANERTTVVVHADELQELVDEFAINYGDKVGVVVTDLATGVTGAKNANTKTVSASLYKLFVAYGIYQKIDDGTLEYTSNLKKYGVNSTVDRCLDIMITVSDNDCGKALGDLLDWAKLDQLLQAEGYGDTVLNNYRADGSFDGDKITTPHDVALLLKRLCDGTLLSTDSTGHFIKLLKDDEINTFLPSGLPNGTVIAHKIGYLYGYVHDAGIIYGSHRNVLVVMMSGQWTDPETTAPPVFAELSGKVWDWMEEKP